MKKRKTRSGETLIASTVLLTGFGIVAIFIAPNILEKMGKDITDAGKYTARVSALIKDTPECAKYKEQLADLGKSAQTINGGLTYRVTEVNNEVNKFGCKK